MGERQDSPQQQSDEIQNSSSGTAKIAKTPQTSIEPTNMTESLRPRNISQAERVVRREEERVLRRATREIDGAKRSLDSSPSATIQPQGKAVLETRTVETADEIQAPLKKVRIAEDRAMVKWAAWAALLISLVTLFLLGLYSSRDFGPVFEYHDLEMVQKQLKTDVNTLQHRTQLEKIENAIIHAQFQIFVRKDYITAETILENAKENLKKFIDSLPIEETVEPKQILSYIDRAIQDVRRGPSSIDENLRTISEGLTKIREK